MAFKVGQTSTFEFDVLVLQFLPRSAIEHSSFLFLFSNCRFDIVCFAIQVNFRKYMFSMSNRRPVNESQCGLSKPSKYSLCRG